jgi:hypothetical protein
MVLGEVIGGREAMPTATDDDDIIGRLWLRRAPGPRPGQIRLQRMTGEGEG